VRMGDPLDVEAVVDWAGHVHGIKNLRVVDASILPEMIAVATNPTVIMVAERIAKMIRTGG
jgi:choline dehydrogenase